ncbi:MAG: (deoxy)nucleoside triphosphate pyrophosphohydrolase [Coriobacteriales bacterium]|jgi:8-oxo-dGTP diphosphatase
MKSIDVVAAIICHEGTVFATQRGYGDFAGKWEFPGGKIEPGETPEEALVREIQEELETTIEVDSLLTTVDYDYDTFHLHMQCFLAHVKSGHLHLTEHSSARWLDGNTIDDVEWLPADVQVIEAIKRQGLLDASNSGAD